MTPQSSKEQDLEPLDLEGAEVRDLSQDIPAPENRQLGRYHLRYQVAQGGMGAVYLAKLEGAGAFSRWVAVKLIHAQIAEDRRFVEMLLDEARITSQLAHPNVCSVLDFGVEDGQCFLVMEYLHGESLATVLKRAWRDDGLPWEVACRIVADAARGLHAAHELKGPDGGPLQVVHRDVSPQNLLVLYEGTTKVLDFGVARARGNLDQTRTGEVKGKLAYMAPEQLTSDDYDRRVDVWALGVVLFEAVAGKRLFRGENEGRTVHKVLHDPVPAMSALRPEVPESLDALLASVLTRDPARRLPTAAAFADALEELLHRAGARAGVTEVSRCLSGLLEDRRAVRDALLSSTFDPTTEVPVVELDSSRTLVTPAVRKSRIPTVPNRPTPAVDLDEATRIRTPGAKRRWAVLGFATLFALGVGVAVMGLGQGSNPPPDDSSPAPETPRLADTVAPADVPPALGTPAEEALEVPEAAEDPPLETVTDGSEDDATDSVIANGSEPDEPRVPARDGPRRRTPAETRTGTLNLVAVPSARVYEGSRLLGETPLVGLSLTVGTHRLELRSIDGSGGSRRVSVTIRDGELTRQSVR